MRGSISWILERMPDRRRLNILDVGGIRRNQIQPIAMGLLDKGHLVHTVDVDCMNSTSKPPNWNYSCGDILDILPTMQDKSFDVVLGVQVLQHIGMPWRGIKKVIEQGALSRFLRGVFTATADNGSVFMDTTIAPHYQVLDWDKSTSWLIFTEELLRDAIEDSGFTWKDHMVYDGASDSKKRVVGAKSIVIHLGK